MNASLLKLPLFRLVRTPRAWIVATAWWALAMAMAILMRNRGASHGADDVLVHGYGALVLPLLAYTLVGGTLGARSMTEATAAFVAFGGSRVRAAAATAAMAIAASTLGGGLLATTVALLAHGPSDPPLLHDALVSGYVGSLGGAAYGAWFSLGAAFGRRGGGRFFALVLDWLLGAGGGAAALAVPRAHVRNLLGGIGPMDLSQRDSAIALAALTAVFALGVLGTARLRG